MRNIPNVHQHMKIFQAGVFEINLGQTKNRFGREWL